MKLSIEVKGKIVDIISRIFSWDKLEIYGMTTGVDTSFFDKKHKEDLNFTKRKAAEYIVRNMPEENDELLIKNLVQMSKRATYDKDLSKDVLNELNSIMKRTMSYRVDENGNILPIFPHMRKESDLILKKLDEMSFTKGYKNYREAYNFYKSSPKGSLALLRSSLEGIVDDMLIFLNIEASLLNMKEKLLKLKESHILRELQSPECPKCHYRKLDHEFNFAYTLYGLLSYYGSHKELVTEELANFLFTSTSVFIWLLINRFENIIKK